MTAFFGLEEFPPSPPELQTTLGAHLEGQAFAATRERIEAYAAVTGYPRERVAATGCAPPVFGAVASITAHAGLLVRIVPHDLLWRSVHLSQSMNFHALIRIDDVVRSRAELVEVRSAPLGCSITMAVHMYVGQKLVTDSLHRVLLRGVTGVASSAPPTPPPPRPGPLRPLGSRVFDLDHDHSVAYAEVSADFLPIHTDPEVARRAGFSGLILHGMCTFAMCAHAAIDLAGGGDPLSLASMSATFTRPVLCGVPLRVEVSAEGGDGLRFTADQQGKAVVRDALARRRGPST